MTRKEIREVETLLAALKKAGVSEFETETEGRKISVKFQESATLQPAAVISEGGQANEQTETEEEMQYWSAQ